MASSAIVGMLAIGLVIALPTYAQRVLGLAAMPAGFLLAAMSVVWSVGSVSSARIYPRVGFRNNALIGISVCSVAALGFAMLPEAAPIWAVAICSAILGLGAGLISTPLIIGLQSSVAWEVRGIVTGAFTFSQQMGQAVGAAVFSSLANSVLIGWFAHAPAPLVGRLPATLNDASQTLAGEGAALAPEAVAYIREGLAIATHQVFLGLVAVALIGVVILLWTPSRFDELYADSRM
jgi:MFS family permease